MIVNEFINRARNSINNILASRTKLYSDSTKSKLVDIRNNLNRLVKPDSPRNDRLRLFCRQMNRLMDYNDPLSVAFWIKLHKDILYMIETTNREQDMSSSGNCFHKRMVFEKELERRELQFQKNRKEEKCLSQLFSEHKQFLDVYLQTCISFHTKVQAQGLVDNLDDFLFNSYGLIEVSLALESRQRVKEKLKCIDIPLNCSNRSLQYIHTLFSKHTDLYRNENNSLSNFIPSAERRSFDGYISKTFEDILQSERWVVILGDPGSGKTSLLRWIMHIFAHAAQRGDEQIVLDENKRNVVRIPVLIRIGEFASWLEHHKNETLIDYIGKHKWFSELYTHDSSESVLKEFIYHGHALILLDGLNEIPESSRRDKIVELVQKFIGEYVQAPDSVSASDDRIFDIKASLFHGLFDVQPPRKSGGNQIVITSRIVGYHIDPLNGPFIEHYSLLPMHYDEAKEFVTKLMLQAQIHVTEVLLNEGIKLDKETVENISKRRCNGIESILNKSSELLLSNPPLLSLICMSFFQSPNEFDPKSRVEVYNYAAKSALQSCVKHNEDISEHLLTNFLTNLACYLHLQSPSGLIDAFDIERLCCETLQQQDSSSNRIELHKKANRLISLLVSNSGIIAEQNLQVFEFQHLSFQNYYVSQSFVKHPSIEGSVKHVLVFIINPRFRESLRLALDWISWKWSSDNYDKYDEFCNLLVTSTENYAIPFGSLLLFDTLNDIQRFPSNSVIFAALNKLLDHAFNIVAKLYLIPNLFKLNKDTIITGGPG